jgi:hypothetical protein
MSQIHSWEQFFFREYLIGPIFQTRQKVVLKKYELMSLPWQNFWFKGE